MAQQLPLVQEPEDQEAPEDLLAAEAEQPDRLLSFLTRAASRSWSMHTFRVELRSPAPAQGRELGAKRLTFLGGSPSGPGA